MLRCLMSNYELAIRLKGSSEKNLLYEIILIGMWVNVQSGCLLNKKTCRNKMLT